MDELLDNREGSVREVKRAVAPPEHSGRLALIDEIVWHLRGSYDGDGVRRWFKRPRPQLNGKCPADALGKDWNPDSDIARQVLSLARELSGAAHFHSDPLTVRSPVHLADSLAVLHAAALLTGNLRDAAGWYFFERIGIFDGLTGEALVLQGRASDVLRYIESLESGSAG